MMRPGSRTGSMRRMVASVPEDYDPEDQEQEEEHEYDDDEGEAAEEEAVDYEDAQPPKPPKPKTPGVTYDEVNLTRKYTDDGVHFFKTRAALKAWQRKQGRGVNAGAGAGGAQAGNRWSHSAPVDLEDRPDHPLSLLTGRGPNCEECETTPAISFCEQCDELLCERCRKLTHMSHYRLAHTHTPFPLTGTAAAIAAGYEEKKRKEREAAEKAVREAKAAAEAAWQAKREQFKASRGVEIPARIPSPRVVLPPKVVLSMPKFKPHERVYYRGTELAADAPLLLGHILPFKPGQLRRSEKGEFCYHVRPEDDDHSIPQLIKESDISTVESIRASRVQTAFNKLYMLLIRYGWKKWHIFLHADELEARQQLGATEVQRIYRGARDRHRVALLLAEKARILAFEKALREKRMRKLQRAQRREDRKARALANGYTIDGKHFFLTFQELDEFWAARKVAVEGIRDSLFEAFFVKYEIHSHGCSQLTLVPTRRQRRSLQKWRDYTQMIKRMHVAEDDHLKTGVYGACLRLHHHSHLVPNSTQQHQLVEMAAKRRRAHMAMLKLRTVMAVRGLVLKASRAEIPVSEHEPLHVLGEDSGVLRRAASRQGLRRPASKSQLKRGDSLLTLGAKRDDAIDVDALGLEGLMPPVPDTERVDSSDSETEGPAVDYTKQLDPAQQFVLEAWLHLGGKLDSQTNGRRDFFRGRGISAAHEMSFVDYKGRTMVQERLYYGNEPDAEDPWHPALNMKLIKLPNPGARTANNGTLQVLDSNTYLTFCKAMKGPVDTSHWLIKNWLLVGSYPEGQADITEERITARSSAIAQLLMAGIDTYVCCLNAHELAAKELPYEDLMRDKAREIRASLAIAVAAAETTYARSANMAAKSHKYADEMKIKLHQRATVDYQRLRRAKDMLDLFPQVLNFVTFPGEHEAIVPDAHVIRLCVDLEARMRAGSRIFIFSHTGRGRAGVVSACLLGRIYGLKAEECLEYVQRCHDTRRRHIIVPPRARALAVRVPTAAGGSAADINGPAKPKVLLGPIGAPKFQPSDDTFFGTSFSKFGQKKRQEQAKRAQQTGLAKLNENGSTATPRSEGNGSVAASPWTASVTSLPSSPAAKAAQIGLPAVTTAEQAQQVRRILALSDSAYSAIVTRHEEGTLHFKVLKRRVGVPQPLPPVRPLPGVADPLFVGDHLDVNFDDLRSATMELALT